VGVPVAVYEGFEKRCAVGGWSTNMKRQKKGERATKNTSWDAQDLEGRRKDSGGLIGYSHHSVTGGEGSVLGRCAFSSVGK